MYQNNTRYTIRTRCAVSLSQACMLLLASIPGLFPQDPGGRLVTQFEVLMQLTTASAAMLRWPEFHDDVLPCFGYGV